MADSNALVKVALVGGAGYVAYQMGWLAFLGLTPAPAGAVTTATPASSSASSPAATPPATTTTATPPATTTTAAPPAANPFTVSGLTTLDKIFAALKAKTGTNALMTVDDFNWYLMQILPGFTAPDPVSVFGNTPFIPGWTRDMKINVGQYWLPMDVWLAQNQGLSGYSIVRGLGRVSFQVIQSRRRRAA